VRTSEGGFLFQDFVRGRIRAILCVMDTVKRADGLKRGVEISAICVILCTPAAVFLIGEHSSVMKTIIALVGVGTSLFALFSCRHGHARRGLFAIIPGLFATFVVLLWFAGLVVTVTSHRLAWLMLGLDALYVVVLAIKSRTWGWALMIAAPAMWTATHVLLASLSFVYLTVPSSRSACEALEDQPGATWFSGAIEPFFAADVHILLDQKYIAATSKIWHDGYLAPLFEGHKEHKVVIMPVSNGDERAATVATAQLPWEKMPQFLLEDSHGNLVTTLIDHHGQHALGVIRNPRDENPTFESHAQLPEGILANGLVEHRGKWLAIDVRKDILWLDPETKEVVDRWVPPAYISSFGPEMMMDFELADERTLYLSTLGSRVFALDLDSKEGRSSEAFGGPGSSVDWVPERKILVGGDVLKYRIRLIESEGLTLLKERNVDFPVRPVRSAHELNLVLAGDYVDGGVYAYRLDTLEPVGAPLFVGGNLRRIAYHPEEKMFYTASKCGVFKIDPESAFRP